MSQNYQQLIHKIDGFIRKYYLNKIVRGLIWWIAGFLISYLVFIVAEYYGYFNITVRSIIFYGFITVQAVLFWFLIGKHLVSYFKLGKTINRQQASVIIGNHFPDIQDKLINTLDLKQLAIENPEQKELIEASINQRIANFKPIPFVAAVNLSENKKYISYALIPIAIVVLLAFAAPSVLKDGTERIINHQVFYKKQAPFEFNVLNKNLVVRQGDDLTLNLKMTGNQVPEEVYLVDGLNTFKLNKKDIINFSYDFKNLQKDKKIRFQAGEFFSDEIEIKVKKKPSLLSSQVELTYPAYLKKKNETLSNPGDLTIPAGTIAKWNFSTEYVDDVSLSINNQTTATKKNNNVQFNTQIRLLKSGKYSINFKNNESVVSDSVAYSLTVITDEYPKIEVQERIDSANVNVLYFIGNTSDDYGLSSLNFHYQLLKATDKNRQGKLFTIPVNFNKGLLQSNFFYVWPLKQLGIKPGEEISYYFDVADNDGVNGSKHTQSIKRIYKLASTIEQVEKLAESTESIQQKMQQAIKKADKIQQETKKLTQDLMDQKNLDYEQKKRIENLVAEKKSLEKLIDDIQKDGKQNLEQSKDLEKQNKDLLEKQKQIQDLFENVLDKKTKDLLENLQKLIDKNQKDRSQDELQKMQLDNKSLQKELDRILELYKKLAVEQKLNNTIDKLEELAKKQEQLSNDVKSKPTTEIKKQQEQLKKDFDGIKKDLKDVQEKNELLEKPEDFNIEKQDQQNIDKDLDNADKNLENNKKQDATEAQKGASGKMQDLAQKLKDSMQGGQEAENKVNEQQLRMILKNLLKTSFDQEKLMLDFKNSNQDDPNFVKLGQKQLEIKENLKTVADSLYSLSKLVPQIQSTVNKEITNINQQINLAIEQITEQKISEANRNQQFALTGINNLALMLSEALQQLQNAMKNAKSGGKGGKHKPGLSELSKMQQQLNKNMQKAKDAMQQQGIMPGQKGGKEISESLAKMAQQQQMIRQALQEVNNSLNKDGQGKLGNLEKIIKQMEQTEADLVNRRITQEALTRQQEIQTRLLEAEKADREREQDNKRESKAPKEFYPNYNLILEEYQKLKLKETQQIKTVPPSLNYFYKNKITEYFKILNLGE
ncbi:DUF4175 family protein [Pedobacter arcticus]|uniref:DUF4175 family protein n=1 Tax=Pedobacter arcticus TaxID=752140 RepID=UPI0002FD618F|nr:DUF4175 family protein [Pedobacter arcticus]